MNPPAIRLRDYTPAAYLVDTIDLDLSIEATFTRVTARCAFRRNPAGPGGPLRLQGDGLELEALRLEGQELPAGRFHQSGGELVVQDVPAAFTLETVVRIQPDANTQLSGLYRSKDGYCTQCEAEGFRRITFFPDRPDVMARYTCTLHADKAKFPVLLANGNPAGHGDEAGGRHWATWVDPYAKPCYLFACVAGKLDRLEDVHVTPSGRRVHCTIFVEPGKLDQCGHAMAALKKSMAWDEEAFGLEMDLDTFMIVAVGDFNMGAMENKGLNIFNTKFVLARPDTATDTDFQLIDNVVAHEYFHNWTGDRVTCRDWFQLSLKEGLTVFRDQSFGMDVHSAHVTRIQDVCALRAAQFPEDAGPMAHPIRPASYAEIDNFYTATVYNKGAEVIRMIATLIGKAAFRRGMELYLGRHDGQAVTCEDFIAAMQDASGLDLGQFQRWYNQAGTPRIEARGSYDRARRSYTLTLAQHYPATAYEERIWAEGEPRLRGPYHMPVVMGLLDPQGRALPLRLAGEAEAQGLERTLQLRADRQEFVFEGLEAEPVPSLLRRFSAPVVLDYPYSEAQLVLLMGCDADPFNRWEAGQKLAMDILRRGAEALGRDPQAPEDWIPDAHGEALGAWIASAQADADPAWVAEAIQLPSEGVIAETMEVVDPDAIHAARTALRRHLARRLGAPLLQAYRALAPQEPYGLDNRQIGRRALRNACLGYLAAPGDAAASALVAEHYAQAGNMTDSLAALSLMASLDAPERPGMLQHFYDRWRGEALVVDKWFRVQALSSLPGTLQAVRRLLSHETFDLHNPNKVNALVRAFCGANPKHFHAADGSGYGFAADQILALDPVNAQGAARLARCFDRWRSFDPLRQDHARAQLRRIQAQPGLSGNVAEVVGKALEPSAASPH